MDPGKTWPELPWARWRETAETLRRIGHVMASIEHAFAPGGDEETALHPTARGLATPVLVDGRTAFELRLDLVAHRLEIDTSDGVSGGLPLVPGPMSRFDANLAGILRDLALRVPAWTAPETMPFERDGVHRPYDPGMAERFWRALLAVCGVLARFRARFGANATPLVVSPRTLELSFRILSGRRATGPSADGGRAAPWREELTLAFSPGGTVLDEAAFLARAAPEPAGFAAAVLKPAGSRYDERLRAHALPYAAVQDAPDPGGALTAFCESAYEAARVLAGWDREALEVAPHREQLQPPAPQPFH
jgi:hypothetical protein